MNRTITIGSRGSALARWQAEYTCNELKRLGYEVVIKYITTKGDVTHHLTFDKIEGKGFFTKEIEEELLAGTIDLAVHSHKDLPTENPAGLIVAACSYSENPADWLLIHHNAYAPYETLNLKKNAIVGTSAARRKSQLLALRPDLEMRDIRGNVPTRIEKLNSGYDAVVLAAAGLNRLNLDLSAYHIKHLNLLECISAPAQGVLAYQIRENDDFMRSVVAKLHHEEVAKDLAVERGILQQLGGGCQQPIGVYCDSLPSGEQIVWAAFAKSWDDFPNRLFMKGNDSQQLIKDAVAVLKNRGKKRVFISRNLSNDSFFSRAMQHYNYQVYAQSLLQFKPVAFDPILPPADWLFFSSKNGVAYFFEQNPVLPPNIRLAAIGEATAESIKQYGHLPHFLGIGSDMNQVAQQFTEVAYQQKVIFPQPTNSLQTVQIALQEIVDAQTLVVYENSEVEAFDIPTCDILIFTSPANAKNYCRKYPILPHQKVIAIGQTTAQALTLLGIEQYIVSYSTHEVSLVDVCY